MTDSKREPGTALVCISPPNKKYTRQLADEICVRIQLGETIQQICEDEHMPAKRTVYEWLKQYLDFQSAYRLAREEAAHIMADRILEIAKKVEDGEIAPDAGRVAIDAQKWVAGRRKPKMYGDRVEHEHSGVIEHEQVQRIERVIVKAIK